MSEVSIYCLINNINNKLYIGQTKNFNNRMSHHKHNKRSTRISKAIQKYGWENFTSVVLCVVDESVSGAVEKTYIKYFNTQKTGYNVTDGGEGCCGDRRILTQEHKNKISKAITGQKRNEDTCRKISAIHKNKSVSEECKEKIRLKLTGTVQSQETKTKRTQTLRNYHYKNSKKWKLFFEEVDEAVKDFNTLTKSLNCHYDREE